MTATDIYLSALSGWKVKEQKRSPVKEHKSKAAPKRLVGGCLLYQFKPRRRAA